MKRVWVGLILFYQRWISPYKGFRCAHGKLHKGLTCSEAVKRIIEEDGVWRGRHRIRRRFRECRFAYYVLLSRPQLAVEAEGLPHAQHALPAEDFDRSDDGRPEVRLDTSLMMIAPDSDKPPIRPEFGGGMEVNESTSAKADDADNDNPKKYFKTRQSDGSCVDCLCFPVVSSPCDAGCAAIDCDVCPCDLPF